MTSLRRFALATAAISLLVLGAVPPAAAGTQEDPEIEGDCGDRPGIEVDATPEYAICQAWFTTLADADGSVTGLVTTIVLGGDFERRPLPSYVTVGWTSSDGCAERWRYADTLGEGPGLTLSRKCAGGERHELRLPPDSVELSATKVTVTISPLDLLALGGRLSAGSVLHAPTAATSVLLRAPGEMVLEAAVGGSRAGPGRDYEIDPEEA